MHRLGAVARQHREVMNFARGAGLDHQAGAGAQALVDQVLVDRRQREQGGDRDMLRIDLAVGDDENVVTLQHRILGLGAQRGETGLDALLPHATG